MTAPDHIPPTDDELVALLGDALAAADPVPHHVVDGAKGAFTWRTIDAELAEIAFDSARDLAGVRSTGSNRELTFQAPGVEIEVMVIDEASRRLVGQLVPPGRHAVDLVSEDGVASVEADRLGRFTFDEIAVGPVRLVVFGEDGAPLVQTEWIVL